LQLETNPHVSIKEAAERLSLAHPSELYLSFYRAKALLVSTEDKKLSQSIFRPLWPDMREECLMTKTLLLLTRLAQIGSSLEQTDHALALIALGSVGEDLYRLDEYSDLDFFVIVQPGAKPEFLTQLPWLWSIRPIVYQFRNTADGYKRLWCINRGKERIRPSGREIYTTG
jgi:hypothetical protein